MLCLYLYYIYSTMFDSLYLYCIYSTMFDILYLYCIHSTMFDILYLYCTYSMIYQKGLAVDSEVVQSSLANEQAKFRYLQLHPATRRTNETKATTECSQRSPITKDVLESFVEQSCCFRLLT